MTFKLKSGNKPGFKQMGATEAIKQVKTPDTGYSSQDKSKMDTQREIYKAKLRGDYMDLTGEKGKASMQDDPTGTVVSRDPHYLDSPAKDMKTGSYEHSFEDSPAKQKEYDGKKNFDNAVKEAQAKKKSELTDMDKEVLRRVAQHHEEKVDLTRKPVGPRVEKKPQEGSSPAKQDYIGNVYHPKWNPGGTVDFEGKLVKKPSKASEYVKEMKKVKKVKKVKPRVKSNKNTYKRVLNALKKTPRQLATNPAAKTVLKGAGQVAKRFLGPVGVALTAYDVGKWAYKNREDIAKQAKKVKKRRFNNPSDHGRPKY